VRKHEIDGVGSAISLSIKSFGIGWPSQRCLCAGVQGVMHGELETVQRGGGLMKVGGGCEEGIAWERKRSG